jgi:hypothetical protein
MVFFIIFIVQMKNSMFLNNNMFFGVKPCFVMWMKNFTLPHSYPQTQLTLNPPFIIVGVYLSGRTCVCVRVCVVIVHLCEGSGCMLWLLCLHGASIIEHDKEELAEPQETATPHYQIVKQKFQFTEWQKWSCEEQIQNSLATDEATALSGNCSIPK